MSDSAQLSQLLGDSGLDETAVGAMQLAADNLGPAIMAGLGDVQLDDIDTTEVLLFALLVDDSGSIGSAGNTENVRAGHNMVLDALSGSKQSASVLISCRYLNDSPGTSHGVLYPYVMLDGAKRLDSSNYNPNGGTPLYDQTAVTLTSVAAKMAEFENGGVPARAVVVIITDGDDVHSYQHTARTVNQMVSGMLRTEKCIIAGLGIEDPNGYVDFRRVFQEMGLRDEWILTPGNSETEIRKAFRVVSNSAVQASQTAGSFSQTALGGFGS
jgi:hypothetical protein